MPGQSPINIVKSAIAVPSLNQVRSAFGIPDVVTIIPGAVFQVGKSHIGKPADKYDVPQGTTPDAALYKSAMGTPVFADITFLEGSYETNIKGVFKTFPQQTYYAVLITVTQPKVIIKTQIQGRDGTVKEYIGLADYNIQVQGIITSANGVYPTDAVLDLKALTDAPIVIEVACTFLNNLGITQMVVDDGGAEFAQQAGSYSYQTFSIPFVSDTPQELRLTNASSGTVQTSTT